MSRLAPAHRGYEYQDLLVACRFVDILLGTVIEARCDEKLFADDRFDDLTTIDVAGRRERSQFKHTDNEDRPLTLESFTADSRGLRLDRLLSSILADRAGAGRDADDTVYRVVLRDARPSDSRLAAVLKPVAVDAGPFLPNMRTQRLGFDAAGLWQQRDGDDRARCPFAFVFSRDSSLAYDELMWACERLVVEAGAPSASLDLSDPGPAEQLLLARVRSDVGAEAFPNADRSATDVAAAMVSAARAARQGLLDPTPEELLRRAQLRSDFGAVSRSHPVDRAVEVSRPATVGQLVDVATGCAAGGGHLLVVGPPGHGKSWISQQVATVLAERGWLVAEHYCYLGDADGERSDRVLAEAVFGSLIGRLAEEDPRLVHDQRPRYAADEDALVACLHRSRDLEPDRSLALVVDGIDHITRIRAGRGSSFDPSKSMSEALASLDMPPGVVVILLSQPGSHLGPLEEAGAESVTLPGLTEREIHSLAGRFGLVQPDGVETGFAAPPLLDDPDTVAPFLAALYERSAGNALYATYLCREVLRSGQVHADPATVVLHLPPFDGTLKSYYDHLYESLGMEAGWVADVVALVDFALTRAELREIRPDAAHRVDRALEVLQPVLIERAAQGGVRVYHESFARYLRVPFQNDAPAFVSLLGRIIGWLEAKGLFVDDRAFRSLLPLLAEAGDDQRVLGHVDKTFVTNAVAAGFSASAINANLATAVGAAARLHDWPTIVRYVEMSRAAESYQEERFDSTLVAFADVPAALLSADTMASRLVDDDRLVMSARAGLQMCAAVDALGATAPWRAYMNGYLREAESDNTSYGEESDRAVAVAWMRGRLRLASASQDRDSCAYSTPRTIAPDPRIRSEERKAEERDLTAPIDWQRLSEWVEDGGLPPSDVIDAVLDTHGWDGLTRLNQSLEYPGNACLAVAEKLAADAETNTSVGSPRLWALAAAAHGTSPGSMRRLLAVGIDVSDLAPGAIVPDREHLLDLTRGVQESSVRREDGRLAAWLDAAAVAARRDPLGLSAAEALIAGDGWYRCWLRFALALCRAEAATASDQGNLGLEALRLLTCDLRPFVGDPRSCDLYSLHPVIAETIECAMGLLDDEQWGTGLRVLSEVSDAITTTLFGELGGPVPPDLVLRLAVQGASPARRGIAEELIGDEITKGSGRRFYSDLAEYRLLAARLALASGDRAAADALWHEACVFLTAYGWHKDITIYEALDPLPALIEADPAAARLRIAQAQGFCERIPLHTDLKETRHAWSRWWKLLAKADPVAAVGLSVPQLLGECNDPNWLLNEALEDVWREWHEHVDPIVSGALRLSLNTPLDPADATQLERLAELHQVSDTATRAMLTWLLARADERPVSYSYTNSDELIARDDTEVARLNAVAETAGVPSVHALRDHPVVDDRGRWGGGSGASTTVRELEVVQSIEAFPSGLPGLVKAIRAWRNRPYDTQASPWMPERFVNVIGYRLLELIADGRTEEAASALRSLADSSSFGERSGILRSIGEGLDRHGETQLAAVAYALAWTRTRAHGGWLTFGGETQIDSLQRATTLDPRDGQTRSSPKKSSGSSRHRATEPMGSHKP